MTEEQGNEVIYLLKEILTKMNNIKEKTDDTKEIIEDILFKLDHKTIL